MPGGLTLCFAIYLVSLSSWHTIQKSWDIITSAIVECTVAFVVGVGDQNVWTRDLKVRFTPDALRCGGALCERTLTRVRRRLVY